MHIKRLHIKWNEKVNCHEWVQTCINLLRWAHYKFSNTNTLDLLLEENYVAVFPKLLRSRETGNTLKCPNSIVRARKKGISAADL